MVKVDEEESVTMSDVLQDIENKITLRENQLRSEELELLNFKLPEIDDLDEEKSYHTISENQIDEVFRSSNQSNIPSV